MAPTSDRRTFLKRIAALAAAGVPVTILGCGNNECDEGQVGLLRAAGSDEECWITLHDSRAVAMYFDGTEGPFTGTVTVDDVVAGTPMHLDFWHGHGGQLHEFDISAADLEALMHGERVTITTTEVEGHRHELYIDMMAPHTWVPGAEPIDVDLCGEDPPPDGWGGPVTNLGGQSAPGAPGGPGDGPDDDVQPCR